MKFTPHTSEFASMSAESCSLRLRIFSFVVITADLINERTTPSLGMSHAIISPVTIFTSYIFIVVLVIGSLRHKIASVFLQAYAVLACSVLNIYLSIVVFRELRRNGPQVERQSTPALVLNGILPMFVSFIAIADLILIMFSNREHSSPVLPE